MAFSVSAGRPAPIRAARCGGRCFPRRTWGNSAAVTTGTSPNARPGKLPGGFPRPRGRRCAGHGLSEGAAAATGLRARSGRPGSLAGFLTAPTCVPSEGTGGNAGSPSRVFLLLETEMTLCVSGIETFFFFAWLVVFITRVDSATGVSSSFAPFVPHGRCLSDGGPPREAAVSAPASCTQHSLSRCPWKPPALRSTCPGNERIGPAHLFVLSSRKSKRKPVIFVRNSHPVETKRTSIPFLTVSRRGTPSGLHGFGCPEDLGFQLEPYQDD